MYMYIHTYICMYVLDVVQYVCIYMLYKYSKNVYLLYVRM